MEFALFQLNHPEEVWRHLYQEQLTVEEKILWHVVYSQKYNTETEDTKLLFDHMLRIEVKGFHHKTISNPFDSSMRKLLDGILVREVSTYQARDTVRFINPSINDFLTHYFITNMEDRWKLIAGSVYIEQFEYYHQTLFWTRESNSIELDKEVPRFASYILDNAASFGTYESLRRENSRILYIQLRTAAFLNKMTHINVEVGNRIQQFVFASIVSYDVSNINQETFQYYLACLKFCMPFSKLYVFVTEHFELIFTNLFKTAKRAEDFDAIKALFNDYLVNYDEFLSRESIADILHDSLDEIVNNQTESWIRDQHTNVLNEGDWIDLKTDIGKRRQDIYQAYHISDNRYDELSYFDEGMLGQLIERNVAINNSRNESKLVNYQRYKESDEAKMVKEIEELFSGYADEKFIAEKADSLGLPF